MKPTAVMAKRYQEIVTGFFDSPNMRISMSHLKWMCEELEKDVMPYPKACRWLGFIQGVLAENGFIDVVEERDFSRPLFHAYEGESPTIEP